MRKFFEIQYVEVIQTQSWTIDGLVGMVGGQVGLFVGGSIISLVQVSVVLKSLFQVQLFQINYYCFSIYSFTGC